MVGSPPSSGNPYADRLGFEGTNLKEAIDATGKGVVFVGYQMQVMVGSTIRSACDLGYELALASDCVGVRETGVMGVGADAVKRIELAILEDAYCIVLESRMITD